MTLHLHLMLWIVNSLTPQEIRDRIMDPNSDFQQKMVEYLEGTHQAEFVSSTMANVEEDIKTSQESKDYQDPTLTLPLPPPSVKHEADCAGCTTCSSDSNWWAQFRQAVNDILYKSNRHQCSAGAGWSRKQVNCSRPCTILDPNSGALPMKQGEARLNSFTPALTYILQCNSDVTSLLSGTAIKAITAYVTDYITKTPLKTQNSSRRMAQTGESEPISLLQKLERLWPPHIQTVLLAQLQL
ncbi:uncharacterized protein C8Q71DRAFT_798818 [Rhodofomes roseus]|uniref:Uncharacterized protein n=1 Tax=Rhodofomes roseus TaxID=34475 RepID=A0ABQ8K4D6_9APHY|nr:uncharacterized protein C8Q71DRAFT_798818 [Rhodofomes roseus]KAH9831730.1 hypothetical protein C8Q71DRAFT_798818 [Rhodofomes roseus]